VHATILACSNAHNHKNSCKFQRTRSFSQASQFAQGCTKLMAPQESIDVGTLNGVVERRPKSTLVESTLS
jgi:hypothetical protein